MVSPNIRRCQQLGDQLGTAMPDRRLAASPSAAPCSLPDVRITNAISGIDLALWDLKGRLLGMPVHKLIGGAFRNKVKVYGSFGR